MFLACVWSGKQGTRQFGARVQELEGEEVVLPEKGTGAIYKSFLLVLTHREAVVGDPNG